MKFKIEFSGMNGCRVGRIFDLKNLSSKSSDALRTPLPLVTTSNGCVPHLTPDMAEMVIGRTAPIVMSSGHFHRHNKTLSAFKQGVAGFMGLQNHGVCVTVQDACKATDRGLNRKAGIGVRTNRGNRTFTPQTYMELIESMQPDWYEPLNDADCAPGAGRNRITKSFNYSEKSIEMCLAFHQKSDRLKETGMFIPLLGGDQCNNRKKWTEMITNVSCDGYTLLGLHNNGPDVALINVNQIKAAIQTSLEGLPDDRPRQASGAWNPIAILDLVELGVDIFDSSYPLLVTNRAAALIFPNKFDANCRNLMMESIELEDHLNKKRKIENEENYSSDSFLRKFELSLKDERNSTSELPLAAECSCYTCENFSCSYIYHLIKTKEMLGRVFLMVHNLHHWMTFFETIRESITCNKLPEFKQTVISSLL